MAADIRKQRAALALAAALRRQNSNSETPLCVTVEDVCASESADRQRRRKGRETTQKAVVIVLDEDDEDEEDEERGRAVLLVAAQRPSALTSASSASALASSALTSASSGPALAAAAVRPHQHRTSPAFALTSASSLSTFTAATAAAQPQRRRPSLKTQGAGETDRGTSDAPGGQLSTHRANGHVRPIRASPPLSGSVAPVCALAASAAGGSVGQCPVCNVELPLALLPDHVEAVHFFDEGDEAGAGGRGGDFACTGDVEDFAEYGDYDPSGAQDGATPLPPKPTAPLAPEPEAGLSVTSLLVGALQRQPPGDWRAYVASGVKFYGQRGFGRRWSCGYRNMQMLAAWLLNEEEYRGRVFKGVGHVISLSALQAELESAWKAGFDTHGAADFGGRVIGGSAWIGSSEVWALLRHYGIRARVMRFGTATLDASAAVASASQSSAAAGNAAKRPRLVQSTLTNGMLAQAAKAPLPSDMQRKLLLWVWRYFSEGAAAAGGAQKVGVVHRPPLYFQHEGHSRTIVGIERRRDRYEKATYMLLVLDPAIPHGKLLASLTNSQGRWQSLIKRSTKVLRKSSYELLHLDGICSKWEHDNLRNFSLDSVPAL